MNGYDGTGGLTGGRPLIFEEPPQGRMDCSHGREPVERGTRSGCFFRSEPREGRLRGSQSPLRGLSLSLRHSVPRACARGYSPEPCLRHSVRGDGEICPAPARAYARKGVQPARAALGTRPGTSDRALWALGRNDKACCRGRPRPTCSRPGPPGRRPHLAFIIWHWAFAAAVAPRPPWFRP